MAEATSDQGNVDSRVELRQAEETGRDHLGKGTFHKVRSFPKNSVAPDKNLSFSCIRANTTVSRANERSPPSLEIQIMPPKSRVHVDGFLPPSLPVKNTWIEI